MIDERIIVGADDQERIAIISVAIPAGGEIAARADAERLAAALERAASNNHDEGRHDPVYFHECADQFCAEATAALAAHRKLTEGGQP